MSEIVDQLAELTGLRDRDTLDVSLVTSIRDLLQPGSVAVHRVVGDAGDERWLTRAHLDVADVAARADSSWADPRSLPLLAERPAWQRCLQAATEIELSGSDTTLLLPLASDAGVIGVVEIVTRQPLTDEIKRLLIGVLRIYRNVQGLLDYSERDTLTGLLNRKSFDETFYKVSAAPPPPVADQPGDRRHGAAAGYWLGVVDIDHFKLVNDRFGHLIGDEVLLLLSRVMRSCFRFYDQVYRFGGEEFVVLLRCAGEEDARAALERFREAVRGYVFPQVEHITVSVGFTDVRHGDSPNAAVERADRAVYFAKNHGRDQVRGHAALVREGLLEDDKKAGDIDLF
ncbi:GGDEF domain-containing protein [Ideonella sp.]|uniref:GGDEF domain-containing protein n=1 Tax=Ideonella sp. TaxID=1929293 RepID=UPI002B4A6B4A|nr:GGDEF domain-containing protein [Ideonella sp.]HJV67869.1 GGDEF domain-containing protein [Ideonella sp.]